MCDNYIGLRSISQDEVNFPTCCAEIQPDDSCPSNSGIDPKNNVMAYIPDWCSYELTPGQMARMIAQIKQEKDYIYKCPGVMQAVIIIVALGPCTLP